MRKITYYRFLKAFYLNNWRMQNRLENILQLFNQLSEIVIMPTILLTLVASAQFGSLLVYVHLILFPIYFYFGGQYTAKKNLVRLPICRTLYLLGFNHVQVFKLVDLATNLVFYFSRAVILLVLCGYAITTLKLSIVFPICILLGCGLGIFLRRYEARISTVFLLVGNTVFDYQTVTIALYLFQFLDYQKGSLFISFVLLLCLVFYLAFKGLQLSRQGRQLIRELKIALNEGGAPLSSFLFIHALFPGGSLVFLYIIASNPHLAVYSAIRLFPIKALLVFLGVSSTYAIYLYAFDLEKMRMSQLRNMGNFIRYKIKYKLLLAYGFHTLIYFTYALVYLLLIPDRLVDKLFILLLVFVPACLLLPLVYFVLTMLFPILKRPYIIGYNQPSRFVLIISYIINTLCWFLVIVWGICLARQIQVFFISFLVIGIFASLFGVFVLILIKIFQQYDSFIDKGKEQIEDDHSYI
ncbi:hypothetical protein [Enterococcus columbae]|uniref:Uncharacterized protein n=1 Tax=Enterococcus columbae DSM 7374 = ATCC 51263 TaxID=1121865 RepID=S0KHJ3_9ENTE|nr:hypothetical protein [Enterococcus columbae]EOT40385.1 hypothetical protein OMW_01499 [Enterococcus columbae DSM 7374 = ATCC 51263]EOW80411.1 hypothetical protein I568_02114 [Enterococcus columbae DSM 7374 = ATCC 51263]OJG23758.1 hypothetical protein RR47_GL000473 [Enterococcus columbae DSM 7374 = ATCC 51263]